MYDRGADLESIRELLAHRGIEIHGEQPDRERGPAQDAHLTNEPGERTMDSMSLFMAEVRRHRLLTRDEEVELARRIERGDLAAKERLVNSNLRLVISNARSYEGLDLPLMDLIQEGMLGLIRAAEKFDWRKGYKFSTYATFWIRESIQRAIANRSRPIRIPVHIGQRERRIGRARAELAARLGREPTDEETAAAAGLDVREVRASRDIARVVTSLDRPVGEEDDTTLGALLTSDASAPARRGRDRRPRRRAAPGRRAPAGGPAERGQAPLRDRRRRSDAAPRGGQAARDLLRCRSEARAQGARRACREPRARGAPRRRVAERSGRQQLPKHELQDAAVLGSSAAPLACRSGPVTRNSLSSARTASARGESGRRRHLRSRERLGTGQAERLRRLTGRELQREHTHSDQVRAVDPLVALSDHRPDA